MPSAIETAAPDDEPPGTWPALRCQAPFGVPECGLMPMPD
jgi:hypothetical protein